MRFSPNSSGTVHTSKYFKDHALHTNTRFSRGYPLSTDVLSAHASHPGSQGNIARGRKLHKLSRCFKKQNERMI